MTEVPVHQVIEPICQTGCRIDQVAYEDIQADGDAMARIYQVCRHVTASDETLVFEAWHCHCGLHYIVDVFIVYEDGTEAFTKCFRIPKEVEPPCLEVGEVLIDEFA